MHAPRQTQKKGLRLLFMGSSAFSQPAFQLLQESAHDIVAVITRKPARARPTQSPQPTIIHAQARHLGIPILTPETIDDDVIHACQAWRADAVVIASYGVMLPQAFLDMTHYGCFNIHPSLLPRWRGASPIRRAMMAGDNVSGCTIMKTSLRCDSGDILAQKTCPIDQNATGDDMETMLAHEGAQLMRNVLDDIAHNNPPTAHKQPAQGITYAHKITTQDARIPWQRPALDVHNHIRALATKPTAWCLYTPHTTQPATKPAQEKRLKILKSTYMPLAMLPTPIRASFTQGTTGHSGTCARMGERCFVSCGQDAVELHTLLREGKKPMTTAEFLRGYPAVRHFILH